MKRAKNKNNDHGPLPAEGSCGEKWLLRKWKQVLNLVYLGMTFPPKLALCHLFAKFCCYWLVSVFPCHFWNPILGMGCRCQSPKFPRIFDCESQRSKTATDFCTWVPPYCPSDKQKRPDVRSCSYQANSRNLENTVTIRNHIAGFLATSLP